MLALGGFQVHAALRTTDKKTQQHSVDALCCCGEKDLLPKPQRS
jgi:hypothetical protein